MIHGVKIYNLKKYHWLQNRQLKKKNRFDLMINVFLLILESTSIKLNFIKSEHYEICGGELRSLKINEFNRYISWLFFHSSKDKV